MTNESAWIRANRGLETRARFGLGNDTQDESQDTTLSAEEVITDEELGGGDAPAGVDFANLVTSINVSSGGLGVPSGAATPVTLDSIYASRDDLALGDQLPFGVVEVPDGFYQVFFYCSYTDNSNDTGGTTDATGTYRGFVLQTFPNGGLAFGERVHDVSAFWGSAMSVALNNSWGAPELLGSLFVPAAALTGEIQAYAVHDGDNTLGLIGHMNILKVL